MGSVQQQEGLAACPYDTSTYCSVCTRFCHYLSYQVCVNSTINPVGNKLHTFMLRTLASRWNKEGLDVFETKTEESEKAGNSQESNQGHMACAASALQLRYDNQTTGQPPALTILYIQENKKNIKNFYC